MLLALSPAIFCTYTTISVQDFHQKLHDGFFAVVVDVYVAVLKPSPPRGRQLPICPVAPTAHRSRRAGGGSPSGRTGTSSMRPTSQDCKTSRATWSPLSF